MPVARATHVKVYALDASRLLSGLGLEERGGAVVVAVVGLLLVGKDWISYCHRSFAPEREEKMTFEFWDWSE
jgi:hypothetical protein